MTDHLELGEHQQNWEDEMSWDADDEELEVLTPAENVNLDVIREVTRKLKSYFESGAVGAIGQTARHYAILTYHAINEPAGYEGNGDEGAMDADIVLAVLMGMDCFEEVERGVFQLAGEREDEQEEDKDEEVV